MLWVKWLICLTIPCPLLTPRRTAYLLRRRTLCLHLPWRIQRLVRTLCLPYKVPSALPTDSHLYRTMWFRPFLQLMATRHRCRSLATSLHCRPFRQARPRHSHHRNRACTRLCRRTAKALHLRMLFLRIIRRKAFPTATGRIWFLPGHPYMASSKQMAICLRR